MSSDWVRKPENRKETPEGLYREPGKKNPKVQRKLEETLEVQKTCMCIDFLKGSRSSDHLCNLLLLLSLSSALNSSVFINRPLWGSVTLTSHISQQNKLLLSG